MTGSFTDPLIQVVNQIVFAKTSCPRHLRRRTEWLKIARWGPFAAETSLRRSDPSDVRLSGWRSRLTENPDFHYGNFTQKSNESSVNVVLVSGGFGGDPQSEGGIAGSVSGTREKGDGPDGCTAEEGLPHCWQRVTTTAKVWKLARVRGNVVASPPSL